MRTFSVKVNGKEYEVEIEETGNFPGAMPVAPVPAASPRQAAQPAVAPRPTAASAMVNNSADGRIVAPMPGTVLSINCENGQAVKKGDVLLVLEAMKMENEIQAPADGKVAEVKVAKGQSVDAGEILVQLTA